jgi:nitrite reductase/ring-hydroxylating ferredoxin subunit
VERWAHYDITTGYTLIDPSRKLKRYPITVEAGNLVVELV